MHKISRCLLGALAVTVVLSGGLVACGGDDDDDDDNTTVDAAAGDQVDAAVGDQVDAAVAGACQLGDVPCVDDILLDLSLHDDKVSSGTVQNTADGAGWVSQVDATAGGYMTASQNPFIYLKFTDTGLAKVEVDDDTALSSQDWDIAARRFIVRLNGGVSGPGCVGATSMAGMDYESITEAPSGATYTQDSYYSSECAIVSDNSGLPGSPAVALGFWWNYASCVQTTDTPAVIQLTDGRFVKLVVEAYYQANQSVCNSTGSPGTTSAFYTWRWSFL